MTSKELDALWRKDNGGFGLIAKEMDKRDALIEELVRLDSQTIHIVAKYWIKNNWYAERKEALEKAQKLRVGNE